MAFFLVETDGEDEREFLRFVRDRASASWEQYTDMTRAFIYVRVERVGRFWFFEFSPTLPPLHYYLFGLSAVLWFLGLHFWALFPALFGGFLFAWYFSPCYILLFVLGFFKKYGRLPDYEFRGSRYVVRELAGGV